MFEVASHLVTNVFKQGWFEMELREEIDALRAILMNDVTTDISDGVVRVDMKLEAGCRLIVNLKETSYHSEEPEIQVVEDGVRLYYLDTHALERRLVETAQAQLEDAYLYSLYQAGQDWIQDNKPKVTRTSQDKPVCKYFLNGRCKFNDKCHNLHPGTPCNTSRVSETINATNQATCKVKVDDDKDEKKPRMRTATDVISRIQWDSELFEADFFVGYSDRFLGIIEKNFAEFCWDDLSTVGMETLAIPKHRIQYFKYKTDIVWDRRSQMDKFFGSRGEGVTIHDLVRKNHTDK